MKVQKNITSQPDVINYFKELPFYYTYIEKPHIKRLTLIYFLSIFFYEELNVMKRKHLNDMQ